MSKKILILIIACALVVALGIGIYFVSEQGKGNNISNNSGTNYSSISNDYDSNYKQDDIFADGEILNVEITFGYDGKSYIAEMENNETAIELVRNITTSGRNLPIYNYDNFEGSEFYQYYDIPTSYKIPSNPQTVTSAKAGELYYSTPNRIILFYQDAQVSESYTKIGEIKDTNGLKESVEDNPVLEVWGNKIISINYAD
jgi:hypothetical protein